MTICQQRKKIRCSPYQIQRTSEEGLENTDEMLKKENA